MFEATWVAFCNEPARPFYLFTIQPPLDWTSIDCVLDGWTAAITSFHYAYKKGLSGVVNSHAACQS
jgi:hypothetical protein